MILVLMAMILTLLCTPSIAGNNDFNMPTDIKYLNGKLLVVDGINNRISVLNGKTFKKLYDITLPAPYGIYAEGGKIYVTSQTNGKIYILSEYGDLLKTLHIGGRPIDIVKVGQYLWITDGKENCIKIVDESGKTIKKIGSKGSAPGDFIGPFMIAKSRNFVFVTDTVNARIQVFDHNGNLKAVFGKFGIEKGNLFRPKGVAACGEDILVSDGVTNAIQMFTPFGGFEKVIAVNLKYPISIDCNGKSVYVLEMLEGNIKVFPIRGDSR